MLLRDSGLRRRLGERGRHLLEKDYASRRMVGETEDLYRQVLAEKLRRLTQPGTRTKSPTVTERPLPTRPAILASPVPRAAGRPNNWS